MHMHMHMHMHMQEKSEAPDAAKVRRIAKLSDPAAMTDPLILKQSVGATHYAKARALIDRRCSGTDVASCGV